jgi:hypothetical protein
MIKEYSKNHNWMIKEYGKNHNLLDFGFANPLKNVKDNEVENMRIKAKDVLRIEEGKHEGMIAAIIERKEPFEYCDVVIRLPDSTATELKVGYPLSLSEASALGRLLARFGVKVTPKEEYDIEKLLKGKKVTFMTINEKNDKGTFARIIPESVKPI